MRISLEWLADFVELDLEDPELPERLANGLLLAGLEVEALERPERACDRLVVAEVLSVAPHPNAERLKVCRLADGARERSVVCGAPNVEAGLRVVLAKPGARMPGGMEIGIAEIRGERSEGMICSERELGLGAEHGGVMALGRRARRRGRRGGAPGSERRRFRHLDYPEPGGLPLRPGRGARGGGSFGRAAADAGDRRARG